MEVGSGLGPNEQVKVPIDFRAAIKGLFNVRFLVKYEVVYKGMPEEEIAKIPNTCRHRY